jgi:hypothetical protein
MISFFGSSHMLMSSFQEMMEKEFQMSKMGELTFFLGIQVKQMKQGTFVHQTKYTKDLMKKFNMVEIKPMSTPMSMVTTLDLNENGEAVDQREYMSMIGSLRYLKYTLKFGIWYSASSSLELVDFSVANFADCGIDRKSTSVTCHFLRYFFVCWSSRKQSSVAQSTTEAEYVAATSCCS